MNKARGSAIIIAMLLISAIGGIAFSFARIAFIELNLATIYENGSVAYYSAESGIEEAFLRYRFDRNTEVPFPDSWTLKNTKIYRTELTGLTTNMGGLAFPNRIGIEKTTTIPDRSKQFYDLSIDYLGTKDPATGNITPIYGQEITDPTGFSVIDDLLDNNYGNGFYSFLDVPKDEAIKIDVSNIDWTNNLLLDIKNNAGDDAAHSYCRNAMELKITVKETGVETKEYKDLVTPNSAVCSGTLGVTLSKLFNGTNLVLTPTQTSYQVNLGDIFNHYGATPPSTANRKVTLSLKPLTVGAVSYKTYIGLTTSTCSNNYIGVSCDKNATVSGPYTYLESTGYYANVTRTLTANIDRQSGTLYDLFDYVIYKGN